MSVKEDINIDSVMSDMFGLFKKHNMDSVDVITIASLIAGGLASVSKLDKDFYMEICEHSYESSDQVDIRMIQ